MFVELVAHEHVLDFHFVVGKIHVKFSKPFLIQRCLDAKAGTANYRSIAEPELTVVLLQIFVGLGCQAIYTFRWRINRRLDVHAVVKPQMKIVVVGFKMELSTFEINLCRIFLLCHGGHAYGKASAQ